MIAPHNILMLAFPNSQLLDVIGPLQMFAAANWPCHLPDFARASRRKDDRNAPLQYRLCHLPRFDTTRFYGASTVALAPSSIGDSHCREIGGARPKRLRARPRADAHLCELSDPRLALRPRGKPGRGRRVLRSRSHRVRTPR